ncbi:HPr family phosphocarrier protein [Haloarchaeobius sp. HME9146]|uniref:HPr family phosphocarrier protein n=1 Tax=Haloarchaeobius sp. HME9146 TaxID=2978732 RepID=UPI0021C0A757|nr:HPr family phosphocarrier protein [Haloarchaeobius sp. HME9146]MCT9097063.1 HPr family phosphocarrier protein [Haloarchaeobius sp. HME9146]
MSERIVEVVPADGLHARPAAKFVEAANEHKADVTVQPVDGDTDPVDARSMLGVTSLGVACGDSVKLTAEGADADEALDALETVLSTPEAEQDA